MTPNMRLKSSCDNSFCISDVVMATTLAKGESMRSVRVRAPVRRSMAGSVRAVLAVLAVAVTVPLAGTIGAMAPAHASFDPGGYDF
ncbi:hypothetical protein [Nocardia sp. NPDC046763]|uniref:hypothetical protein n=1 Tax=Nocardia sp. NPDC046763 TaxID=3155256 RepID=UPI0033E4246D